MSRGQAGLFFLLAACLVIVGSVILHDVPERRQTEADMQFRFQQSVGGVGLGAVLVPAWNFSDYDPRLRQWGDDVLYPVPAGYSYSPDRLVMVTRFGEN